MHILSYAFTCLELPALTYEPTPSASAPSSTSTSLVPVPPLTITFDTLPLPTSDDPAAGDISSRSTSRSLALVHVPDNTVIALPDDISISSPSHAVTISHDTTIRNYDELLDQFSLHQFIIRKGKTMISTPEFHSYKRKYYQIWGQIQYIINCLETVCQQYQIESVTVHGERCVELAGEYYCTCIYVFFVG